MSNNSYVISEVPWDKLSPEGKEARKNGECIYYCHMRDYPDIPVFGSFGTRKHAKKVCDTYNGKVVCWND